MARRAGKAANRKARQRKAQRRPAPAAQAPAAEAPRTEAQASGAPPSATAVPPVGTPHAREAASLTPPRRVTRPSATSLGSTLTDAERAEYHYVERDLRNIGVLTAIMAVMLLVAWIAFSALGLVG